MKKVRLGDIATVITKGTTPTTLGYNFVDDGVNFVKIESITENGEFLTDKFAHISDECNRKLSRSQLQRNDLLFSIAGAIGRTAIVTDDILPANTNQALAIIRVPEGEVDYSYLKHILQSPAIVEQFEKKKQGVAQLNISLKDIGDFVIPLRPAEEQKSIVATMDKVCGLIALRKEQLAKLDQLVKSRFIELFGATSAENCTKQIKDYAEVLGGYAFKSDLFCSDAIPVIRISNINNGCVELDYNICFDELFWEQNKRFRVEQNDVLMAMSGATTGKAGVYRENMPALINQRVACIRAKDGVACPTFLFVATQLEWMYDLIQETSAGCAQHNISGKQIENMPVPDASDEQHQQVASFGEQTDKSKLAIQESLAELETLKKALLQKYFG